VAELAGLRLLGDRRDSENAGEQRRFLVLGNSGVGGRPVSVVERVVVTSAAAARAVSRGGRPTTVVARLGRRW
jgi:hypothetical protein